MLLPANFFHPLLVHFPIVLPFVCLFLFVVTKERRVFIMLLAVQLLLALLAFYSGSWAGEAVVEELSVGEQDLYGWHYFYGRVALILSAVSLIFGVVASLAKQKERVFSFLCLGSLVMLSIVVALSGYTGGSLVHNHQVNKYFIEK